MTTMTDPVGDGERIAALDVLRGFALLGIFVMNVQSFSMISAAYLNPTAYGDLSGANWWVWVFSHLLTDQKMYGLFSMLFGAGVVLMTARAEARGERAARVHFRRMGWLVFFGLLHAHLFWYGDILYAYGLCGMLVYVCRRWSPGTLVPVAAVFYAIGSAVYLAIGWSMPFWGAEAVAGFTTDAWQPTPRIIEEELAAYRGGWLTQLPHRVQESLFMETILFVLIFLWKTVANMLLGMALFKSGVLSGGRTAEWYTRAAVLGFLLGLSLSGYGIWRNVSEGWPVAYSFFVGSQFNYWAAIATDVGWIGVLMLWLRAGAARGLTARLAAVGQMAFTNYIMQTVIATTIFYGHGFGLFGSVSRVGQFAIVLAVWALQLVVSPLWLREYRFGPLEWVWRSLTYGRRMPLRRAAAAVVA
jgi:uncharacterized protein